MATVYLEIPNVIATMIVLTIAMKLAVVRLWEVWAGKGCFACISITVLFSVCYEGDIHLTGQGSSVTKGNVELCLQNKFLAICGNVWSSKDAKVVCRQLGYNNSMLYTYAITSTLFSYPGN